MERKEHSPRELLIEKTRWLLFLGAQVRCASEYEKGKVVGLVWAVANLLAAEEETAEIALSVTTVEVGFTAFLGFVSRL